MIWTVAALDVTCGACGARVLADTPLQLLTTRKLIRCQGCAIGPVDDAEVDLERARLEMDRAREAMPTDPDRLTRAAMRQRDTKPTQGFSSLMDCARPLFEPKRTATGDRE